MKSVDFRAQNNIIASYRIVEDGLSKLSKSDATVRSNSDEFKGQVGDFAVIDTFDPCGKNSVSSHSHGFSLTVQIDDPVLDCDYKKLKESAWARGTEIITQEDAPDLTVSNLDLKNKVFDRSQAEKFNTTSLDHLARELDPLGSNWAIDVLTDQFVLYTPKKTA